MAKAGRKIGEHDIKADRTGKAEQGIQTFNLRTDNMRPDKNDLVTAIDPAEQLITKFMEMRQFLELMKEIPQAPELRRFVFESLIQQSAWVSEQAEELKNNKKYREDLAAFGVKFEDIDTLSK